MPTAVTWAGFSAAFVCVSVCLFFTRYLKKPDAARITKLDIEMFYREFWKADYFGIKRSKVKVTRHTLL